MPGGGDSKWGGKKMEGGGDSVRTVDCLRGRLLAERSVSRAAKDEARRLENKLMELEIMLKREVESRNRAEKKTKSLLKKLESASNSRSRSMGKIVISHPSSSSSTSSMGFREQVSVWGNNFPSSVTNSGSEGQNGNFLFSEGDENSERSSRLGSDRSDTTCYHRLRFPGDSGGVTEEDDDKCRVDDSMALVAVDGKPRENRATDPEVLDSAVKEVLDTLKLAKERLQKSMEEKRLNMIKVG